ncbi:MAG: nuclear transport factor 2 family protein [Sulfuritalea sp.]|nr:nuclear transport factor 2 family protein [Sulfuritalea sp.]
MVASAATVPEHAPAIPVAAILPPTKTAATVKDGTSSVINVNEVMQKSLAEALANTFNAKPADAGSAKPKSHDARTVAAIPDESFAPPVKAKKTKPAVKKPVVESVDTEAAPVVTPVTAAVSAPAAAVPESPAAVPLAAAPAVAVAPAAVEPAKPAVAVKRKYVDRKLDPNEGASSEERAKIDRLMEEARATTPAAKNPAPATPPAAVPGPGVGVTADPGMRTVLTPSRTEVPRAVAPVQLASADPGPLRTAAGAIADTDPRDTLKAWADAWSSRDVARYFRLYAKDFVAYDAQNKAEFIARRSSVMSLANSIELKVEPVSVSIRGNHATIRFWQNYTSPRFSSRVMKALELTNEGDGWKIRRERLVNFVPANAANA